MYGRIRVRIGNRLLGQQRSFQKAPGYVGAVRRARAPVPFYLLHNPRFALPGAGNARRNFGGHSLLTNRKLPACLGAGNARQFIGGRVL